MKKDAWDLERALEVLRSRGWYSERSKETQKRLAEIARLRTFEAHEPIYLAGQTPNGVFGLVEGSIKIAFPRNDGENYVAHHAGAGFWLVTSLISPTRRDSCRSMPRNRRRWCTCARGTLQD